MSRFKEVYFVAISLNFVTIVQHYFFYPAIIFVVLCMSMNLLQWSIGNLTGYYFVILIIRVKVLHLSTMTRPHTLAVI